MMRHEPRETTITAGNIRLHLRDWGGLSDRGAPILLVHGLASNARIWDLVAPQLAAQRRVVAIDQRGHGLSEKPTHGYDFATVTADLAAAIETLGFRRPLVVGHSWGASVVLSLAVQYPQLVSAIAMVDGGTAEFRSVMSLDEARQRLTPPRLAGTPRALFIERVRQRMPEGVWSPEVEQIILGNFAIDADDRIAPHLTFENHMQVVDAMWEQQTSSLFPRVACPTLIITASQVVNDDAAAHWLAFKRASVNRAATEIPYARSFWLEDTIHDIPLHRPELLARRLLEFAAAT